MSEINNAHSTLEKAAHDNFSAGAKAGIGSYARSMYENKKHSFINGALWQREQDQSLLQEAQEIINIFIGNTKTGGYRDHLTEFNIKLLTHLKNLSK